MWRERLSVPLGTAEGPSGAARREICARKLLLHVIQRISGVVLR